MRKNGTVLGIDIGTNYIKIAEVVYDRQKKVRKVACTKLPESVPAKKMDKIIANAIRSCCRENKIKAKEASICLPSGDIVLRNVELPRMKPEEILANLRFELSENYSVNIEDYQLDYKIIDEQQEDKNSSCRIMAAAAPRSLIRRLLEIAKKAGLKPRYVDVSANACWKMIKRIKCFSEGTRGICVIDVGHSSIEINAFRGNNFYVSTAVEAGGKLLPSKEKDGVDYEVKKIRFFDRIVFEAGRIIEYYNNRNYDARISTVLLAGGYAYTEGLAGYLSMQLGLDVEVVDASMFEITSELDGDIPAALYFKSIGTAIREDI